MARALSLITILLVMLLTCTISMRVLWKGLDGEGWRDVIRSDARGYYGYLTSIFIRGDLGNEPYATEYIHRTPTGTLNKYFSGTALFMAPWFAIGHDLALGDPKAPDDGFSAYEMKAISIGAWVYLLLGLLALRSLLHGLHVRDEVVAWLLLMVGAGSTLLQYSAIQPGWSHIYSFCTICLFLLSVQRISAGASVWWLVGSAALFGAIILIRPVNAMVLLGVPVVLVDRTLPFLRRIFMKPLPMLAATPAFLLVVSVQPFLWHQQTGNWFEWGYRGEGFYWDRPEILNVLFSFRRGLFVWTPFFLFCALAVFLLWRRDRARAAWSLLYWTVTVYLISAWWIWYYGSGFGSRVFIDHYAVLIIPLALVLERATRAQWLAARTGMMVLLALHTAQFAQFHLGILHHEHMDRTKYMRTFLRFEQGSAGALGGKWEVPPYAPEGLDQVLQAHTDLEREHDYWREGLAVADTRAYSGRHVHRYDEKNEFGITFIARPGDLPVGRELFLEVRLMRYEDIPGASRPALAVTTIQRADGSFAYYGSFPMNHVPGTLWEDWSPMHYRIAVPAINPGEELRFYIWNKDGRGRFLLDDLFIRVWAVRPYPGMTGHKIGAAGGPSRI